VIDYRTWICICACLHREFACSMMLLIYALYICRCFLAYTIPLKRPALIDS